MKVITTRGLVTYVSSKREGGPMRRIDEGPEHLTAEYRTPDDIRRLFERYRTALSDPLPRLDPSVGSSGRKTQRAPTLVGR